MISFFFFMVIGVPSLFSWAIVKKVYESHKRGYDAFRHLELIRDVVKNPEKYTI